MSDDDEDQPEEILGKRGKKGQKNKPLPETPDEIEALIRRQKRNLRKAWAEGYLTAITAMLTIACHEIVHSQGCRYHDENFVRKFHDLLVPTLTKAPSWRQLVKMAKTEKV